MCVCVCVCVCEREREKVFPFKSGSKAHLKGIAPPHFMSLSNVQTRAAEGRKQEPSGPFSFLDPCSKPNDLLGGCYVPIRIHSESPAAVFLHWMCDNLYKS